MSEKEYVKMLKERDKPMPMGQYHWLTEKYSDRKPADTCGACGELIVAYYKFCPMCGQRIDHENYKL